MNFKVYENLPRAPEIMYFEDLKILNPTRYKLLWGGTPELNRVNEIDKRDGRYKYLYKIYESN